MANYVPRRRNLASMGPRPFGHGNSGHFLASIDAEKSAFFETLLVYGLSSDKVVFFLSNFQYA